MDKRPVRDSNRSDAGRFAPLKTVQRLSTDLPEIELDQETLDPLDGLRVEDEGSEEIITELINSSETEELTLSSAGDRIE